LLDELPPGSKVAILDSSQPGGEFREGPGLLRKHINDLKIQPANSPVTVLLNRAYGLFAELEKESDGTTEPPPRYLYIFSDRTRACWDSADVRNLEVPDGVSSVFVDVGVKEPEDLGIKSLVVDPVSVAPGREFTIVAHVRATGKQRVKRKVICQIDGRHLQEDEAQVGAGSAGAVRFTYHAAPLTGPAKAEDLGAGSHQVVVRLEGTDRLPVNNTRFATFVVNRGRKVLLLADAPRLESVQYFNAVLQSLSYATTVSPISNLRGIKLDNNYDVVWLFQTENINEEGWDKLYGYVDGGGKLA